VSEELGDAGHDLLRLPGLVIDEMVLAVAATALLVLVIVRLLPGTDVQFRGVPRFVKVQVITDSAIARARPSDSEPVVATLSRGTEATRLEQSGEWTRIELPDGRRVWVRSAAVSQPRPTP
jgi:SH3-like domain-containing protein